MKLQMKVKELEYLVGKLSLEKKYLKRCNKARRARKKALKQIFTSVVWEMLKRGAE